MAAQAIATTEAPSAERAMKLAYERYAERRRRCGKLGPRRRKEPHVTNGEKRLLARCELYASAANGARPRPKRDSVKVETIWIGGVGTGVRPIVRYVPREPPSPTPVLTIRTKTGATWELPNGERLAEFKLSR